MAPHAFVNMVDNDNGLEPQLVNGKNIGWSSPASEKSTETLASETASEPIAIVGMGKFNGNPICWALF